MSGRYRRVRLRWGGRGGGAFTLCSPNSPLLCQRCKVGSSKKGCFIHTDPLSIQGRLTEWRQGSSGQGEKVSPLEGSIVSKNMWEGTGGGLELEQGQDRTRRWQKKNNRQDLQNDSSCPTERSPLGVEARDEPLSMLSEPELWCCCSEPALDVMVDEEVEEDRVFSLKSVMITVTFPTVMANCWAVLLSMFFSFGLWMEKDKNTPNKSLWSPKKNLYFLYTEMSQLGFHKSVN